MKMLVTVEIPDDEEYTKLAQAYEDAKRALERYLYTEHVQLSCEREDATSGRKEEQ